MVTPCRDLAAGGQLGTAVQWEVGMISIAGMVGTYSGDGAYVQWGWWGKWGWWVHTVGMVRMVPGHGIM